jgi:glutamyl-tRNA(Gln) amidotransferase subunit E
MSREEKKEATIGGGTSDSTLPFDPESCQLRVGLEIHQQLATSNKLFCECPIIKSDELPLSFERRLRPTQSEFGQIDPAAIFEFNRGRVNQYRWNPESSCLVEADEEPPHLPNKEAVETALIVGEMFGSTVVDEVHVMRKIVIDGSNTSGFQRTAVIALGGRLPVGGGSVGVQTITVEEDSSRVLTEGAHAREYALDRLGVPLVEVALDHIGGDPEHVEAVALALGRSLRSTGRVARGQGTIRQDLNVSLLGGQVVEVKGVQKLNLIGKVVRYEATRQMGLVKIAEEIAARGMGDGVGCTVTRVDAEKMKGTGSPILRRILQKGGSVICVAAAGLGGLLGMEPFPGVRLGKELAEVARANGLGGVIHSDEFVKQGVMEGEAAMLRALVGSDANAALVLIAGEDAERVETTAALVAERLRQAPTGVLRETRAATEEGETRYQRPRPGAARMYPETDIPEIVVTEEWKESLKAALPVPWEEKVARYSAKYSLSREAALQLYDSGNAKLFEEMVSNVKLEPSVIASMLVELPVRLSREGIDEARITPESLASTLEAVDQGRFAKEAAVDVLRSIGKGDSADVDQAVSRLGLTGMSDEELEAIIGEVLLRNRKLIDEKGDRAFSTLMGDVMKLARGKVDGQKVSKLLKQAMMSSKAG